MNTLLLLLLEYVSLRNVLLYSAVFLATWLFYKAAVEPFLSPIREIPGLPYINPLLGNMRYLLTGEAMETSIKMIKEFGPLVRYYFMFGRERVLVADPDILKHILLTNAHNYIKPPQRMRIVRDIVGNGLIISEGALHAMHKRLMKPSFNTRPVAKMMPLFERCCNKLVEYWKKSLDVNGAAVLPVEADVSRTTLDVIGHAAFGYEFDSLTSPDHKVATACRTLMSGISLSWKTVLPFGRWLPFSETRSFYRNIDMMKDVVMDIISKKRQLLNENKDVEEVTSDVLGMMMAARDLETCQGMSDDELRDQVMTLMLAGHETTAAAMTWCLLMLARHPDVQRNAREEVMSVLGTSQRLNYDDLDKLEYCDCVVKETLRYLPPVPMLLRQAKTADVLPGDWHIPAGTILLLSLGPMMRREELFRDADSFKPERFLRQQTDVDEPNTYHYVPFIYGPSQCLGYRFAGVEMRALLAILLHQFQFEVDPDGPVVYKRRLTLSMRPDPPLHLKVSLIDPSWAH